MISRMRIATFCVFSTGLLLGAMALLAGPAAAGILQITVSGANGRPAADAVVLVRRATPCQVSAGGPPVMIEQRDLRFMPYVTVITQRGTVRFVNHDRYAHHVRSMPSGPLGSVSPSTEFEFRLPAARGGTPPSADQVLDLPGPIVLGCHLHGSMRGHIFVSSTPWFGISDAQGRVTIDVPDGPADVQVWHPDQLSEQPARPLNVTGTVQQAFQLNFSPRVRPPPRSAPPGDYPTQ